MFQGWPELTQKGWEYLTSKCKALSSIHGKNQKKMKKHTSRFSDSVDLEIEPRIRVSKKFLVMLMLPILTL
jgi:predicted secreted Zn-dependent protease